MAEVAEIVSISNGILAAESATPTFQNLLGTTIQDAWKRLVGSLNRAGRARSESLRWLTTSAPWLHT